MWTTYLVLIYILTSNIYKYFFCLNNQNLAHNKNERRKDMQNKLYNEVPNILTGKDLDYLSDMFEWNYGALKKMNVAISQVQDEQIKTVLEQGYNLFKNNLNVIISILNEGGTNE